MCNQLKENGKEYGVDFKFEQALTFNTSKAHQLIKWANLYGKSSEVKEALMIAHFSKGMDLSDPNSILEVVKELNLNTSEANTVLKSNEYWEEVQEDIKMASERKITGVPYFVINNQQSISGAQSDEVFISIINSALNNLGSSNTTKSAKVCKPQTGCE